LTITNIVDFNKGGRGRVFSPEKQSHEKHFPIFRL